MFFSVFVNVEPGYAEINQADIASGIRFAVIIYFLIQPLDMAIQEVVFVQRLYLFVLCWNVIRVIYFTQLY